MEEVGRHNRNNLLIHKHEISMKKNYVYSKDGQKMVCILADDEYACLCPIRQHRHDRGYRIFLTKNEIFSQHMLEGFEEIGHIDSPNLIMHTVSGYAN